MNTKQLFLPRPLRILFKKGRSIAARKRAALLTLRLRAGHPSWIAGYLREQNLSGRVVLAKQGVLGIMTPQRYLRFTQLPKAKLRLTQEVQSWERMREAGLGDIVARFMEISDVKDGLVVGAEPLSPIGEPGHVQKMLPVVRRLVAESAPKVHGQLPESISAGLAFAKSVGLSPGLDVTAENELKEAFAAPLLTGYSHQDLHCRNVLHRNGEPVLIDLKKCQPDRLLCLDLLNMACLSLTIRTGDNVVNQAYLAHRRGWMDEELRPILSMVDLPRKLWGPAYVLHVAGLHRMGRPDPASWSEEMLFRRILGLDWSAV